MRQWRFSYAILTKQDAIIKSYAKSQKDISKVESRLFTTKNGGETLGALCPRKQCAVAVFLNKLSGGAPGMMGSGVSKITEKPQKVAKITEKSWMDECAPK